MTEKLVHFRPLPSQERKEFKEEEQELTANKQTEKGTIMHVRQQQQTSCYEEHLPNDTRPSINYSHEVLQPRY